MDLRHDRREEAGGGRPCRENRYISVKKAGIIDEVDDVVDDDIIEDEDKIKEEIRDEGDDGIKVEDEDLVEDVVVKHEIKDEVQDEIKDKIKEEVKYKMKDEINGQRGCVHGSRRRDGDAVFATQYSIINSIIFDKLNVYS